MVGEVCNSFCVGWGGGGGGGGGGSLAMGLISLSKIFHFCQTNLKAEVGENLGEKPPDPP